MAPAYTYADPQHMDSGCTPEFVPQSCDGENNTHEYTLVELPNTTWETSIYYKKFWSVTEDQCRNYCLNDCYCAAALMVGGTDCTEVAALTNGRQASDVTTKALIKVRRSSNRPAVAARTRTIVAVTVCVAFVLLAIAGGFLARHYLAKNRESQGLLSDGGETVTLFGWAGQLVSNQKTELILHQDDDAMADLERVERFARVAFWCIDPNPSLRPTMHHVVQLLETVVV
ncbi:hypothetical protein ACQ4PT_008417 [Festuca glaucescens]